jgi:two-component system, NarL family, sensor histidine kinase UhpB
MLCPKHQRVSLSLLWSVLLTTLVVRLSRSGARPRLSLQPIEPKSSTDHGTAVSSSARSRRRPALRLNSRTELERLLRKREDELEESRRQVAQQRTRLQALSLEVQQAQEAERRRIALELHDTVARQIIGALFALEGDAGQASAPSVRQACLVLRRAHVDIHHTIFGLRPPVFGPTGLAGALRGLIEAYHGAFVGVVRVSQGDAARRLAPDLETAVYRAMQEGVHNIAAHSGARRVVLTLAFRPDGLYATLQDDGRGFDAGNIDLLPAQHLGILGMRQRLEDLGGRLIVDSSPGAGSTLTFFVPVVHEAAEAAAAGDGDR